MELKTVPIIKMLEVNLPSHLRVEPLKGIEMHIKHLYHLAKQAAKHAGIRGEVSW